MMLSACDECQNRTKGRKCTRFPNGRPKNFHPYVDVCDAVNILPAKPVQALWETFQEYADRCKSTEPYNQEFIDRCKQKYREYMTGDPFFREDSINMLMKAVPFHFRQAVINA